VPDGVPSHRSGSDIGLTGFRQLLSPLGLGSAAGGEFELASRLAEIVASSSDAIIGKTLDGTVTSWNAGAAQMYGYTADEVVGRNISLLLPPDRAGELAPILDRLGRGERVEHFETKRRCKDGRVIDVSVSISPIRDAGGAVAGAATVARDLTGRNQPEAERRAIMQERRESERREFELASRLAAIVESSELAIVGLTRDNVVASWNAAAERMFGYAASEIIGRSASLLWPPDASSWRRSRWQAGQQYPSTTPADFGHRPTRVTTSTANVACYGTSSRSTS